MRVVTAFCAPACTGTCKPVLPFMRSEPEVFRGEVHILKIILTVMVGCFLLLTVVFILEACIAGMDADGCYAWFTSSHSHVRVPNNWTAAFLHKYGSYSIDSEGSWSEMVEMHQLLGNVVAACNESTTLNVKGCINVTLSGKDAGGTTWDVTGSTNGTIAVAQDGV